MLNEYRINKFSKLFLIFIFAVCLFGIKQSYDTNQTVKMISFTVLLPIVGYFIISAWAYSVILDPQQIVQKLFMKSKVCRFDEIREVRDDYFLMWHIYWVLTDSSKITMTSFGGGLQLNNMIFAQGKLLLANLVVHLKPGAVVSASILNHLGMSISDIGKFYGTNKWLDKVQAKSYWNETYNLKIRQ